MLNMRPFPRDYQPLGLAIEPKSDADRERLLEPLQQIAAGDPSCMPIVDPETGRVRIPARSEAHIAEIVAALGKTGIAFGVGAPQVAYREMPTVSADVDYTHQSRSGGAVEFARVRIRFEPNPRSLTNTFLNGDAAGEIPAHFLSGIEQGLRSVTACGPLRGYPVVACRITLLGGAFHETDSSVTAFEIAARAAFLDAGPLSGMKLFEPMLEIEINTPKAHAPAVLADFKSRRGVSNAKEATPGIVTFAGFAPLATMLGYDAHLKSIAGQGATHAWKLAGLEEVRPDSS